MPMFRVTLERPAQPRNQNPFRPVKLDLSMKTQWNLRSWEFEAKDEDEVRALLDEAYKQKLSNVVGYSLRSIECIDE